MNRLTDPKYLKKQYGTASQLNARIFLHQNYSTNNQDWHKWVFDHFHLKSGMKVLEVGAGPGKLWQMNAGKVLDDCQIILSDFSCGMLQNCQNNGFKRQPFSFTNLNAEKLPFKSSHFDLVIANHMLYHVPDIRGAIMELSRVLKPDGVLFAATNGEDHMLEMHELARTIEPPLSETGWFIRRFSLSNGVAFLQAAFNEVDCEQYIDSLEITDVNPFVAYIASIWEGKISETQITNLRNRIAEKINRDGMYQVKKQTGLFICKQPSLSK